MCVTTLVYFRCGCLFKWRLHHCKGFGNYDEYLDRHSCCPSPSESSEDTDEPTEPNPYPQCIETYTEHYLVFGHPSAVQEKCFRWRLKNARLTGRNELVRVVSGLRPEAATGEAWEEQVKEILEEQTAVLRGRSLEEDDAREVARSGLYYAIDGPPLERLPRGIWEDRLAEILEEQTAKAMAEQDAKVAEAEERRKRFLGL